MRKNFKIDKFEVGKRLEKARVSAGFERPSHAARALGVGESTYTNAETAKRPASPSRLAYYAFKFGVTLDWLLTGKGRGPANNGQDRVAQIFEILEDFDQWSEDHQRQAIDLLLVVEKARRKTVTVPTS
ncbi:XRE family transcriptional regulator [Pseudaminobacter arsenicus]|uniref:XRE family transcriptional regulator n=1 Tax=Borborobacter arsenicus TaxID=1851146 RepID=A0A432VA37_9HYPH|nr:helix-turn-helix transcriptional regulator [Pseudaminobacter arsenicus]RUM98990.1 XRE family transcriptional regulator [Pseudaminobacter arsenicus]